MRKPLFSSNHHFDILICLGLVLAIFIPYHQVASHRFIEFDDGLYAFQNTYIIKGMCWESIRWAFTNSESANWHPLSWISHLVDRELYGAHAGGYLLESAAWHALATCLCYLAFFRTTGRRLFGVTVALFFALHPVNVENVAWLSERKSILNAVFWFAALIAYVDFIERPSFRAYGITAIAFLLSLMSKPMSITLPGTLVLIHALYLVYHPARRDPSARLRGYVRPVLLPVLPLLVVSMYFTAVTILTQTIAMPGPGYSLGMRLCNTVESYGRYVAMFFHPTELANFYPLFQGALTFRAAAGPLLAIAALSTGALLLVRRAPQLLLGWCWYLGTLVPVIGLIQVGSQSHADRYLYVPMLGLAFVYPVLFDELRFLRLPWRRALVGGSLAVLAAAMTAATWIQVSYWKDGVSLFRHSLAVTGDCVTSVMNLAVAYYRTERFPELVAFADAKIAVAANPTNQAKLSRFKASGLYSMLKYKEAIAAAQQAVDWGDRDDTTYWLLAITNFELGNLDEAAKYLPKERDVHQLVTRSSLVETVRAKSWAALEKMLELKRAEKNGAPAAAPSPGPTPPPGSPK